MQNCNGGNTTLEEKLKRLARLEMAAGEVRDVLLDRLRWGSAYYHTLDRLVATLDAALAMDEDGR